VQFQSGGKKTYDFYENSHTLACCGHVVIVIGMKITVGLFFLLFIMKVGMILTLTVIFNLKFNI
jgi:hypothetical protein